MKKTITSALLTLALVGFANAAPPAAETVDSLKAKVEALSARNLNLLANNQILKGKIKELTPSVQVVPTTDRSSDQFVHPKAKDVVKRRNTVVTRKQLQEAYVKAFDLNKDGQVSIKETPNRKQRNEFLHNFQNDNYRQDEIPVAQRRNSKPPKTKLKPRTPPKTKLKPRTPNSVEQKPARNILQGTRPEISGIGMPYGQLLCGTGYGRTPVPHITMSEAKAMLSKTRK